MDEAEVSYLDYETFLDPSFSPTSFANTLVLATNNANDTPLDLTTPLSRVLFDVQEVDTRLDKLTSTSALPILDYTRDNVAAGEKVLQELETQVTALTHSYERMEVEITQRHEQAEETRLAATRMWETVKLGRSVGRCLTFGRQLEAQMTDLRRASGGKDSKEDHRAMVRGANTIISVRQIFNSAHRGGEGEGLDSIHIIRTLRDSLIDNSERGILSKAEQTVAQFSMSSLTAASTSSTDQPNATAPTFAQIEDTRSRATSALLALYLLSPVSTPPPITFEPTYLISILQEYLRRAITSSLAGLTSALTTLPKLERTLLEVSARCQNIVALEILLGGLKPPDHPLLSLLQSSNTGKDSTGTNGTNSASKTTTAIPETLLAPLLTSLDTSSLPSYFWRSMSSQLSSRVQKIVRDGGVSARTLRSNKDRVRDAIRHCVNRGSTLPGSVGGLAKGREGTKDVMVGNWEREAAVMVGAVLNALGR